MNLPHRFIHLIGLASFALIMSGSPTLATDHVYTAGDKVRRWDLPNPTTPSSVWNYPGVDVATDPAHGKIFWAVNSGTNTGKIMVGNLNNSSQTPTVLLTTTWIDEIQFDATNQMIYWDDVGSNRIYQASTAISNPPITALPLNPAPTTLRAFALDLRPSKLNLYYLDSGNVYRAGLNGSNTTQLTNNIGDVFTGIAVDTCRDQLIAVGVTGANPTFPAIMRADLSNAGNQTIILQDPMCPCLNCGQEPRKVDLDLNAGVMYWTASLDVGGISTLRRAYFNGTPFPSGLTFPTGPTVIAQSSTGSHYWGLALELANTMCSTATVGVNKDLLNNSGQAVNDIEILLAGTYTNVNHYDGWPSNAFSSFTEAPAPGGNTLLTWSNPNNDVQPGQIAHVGFNVPGTLVTILSVSLTHNGSQVGCVQQVSTGTHSWGSPGSQVIYTNNTLGCAKVPRYVGALVVEWHAREVPLADLNPRTPRKPIRIDKIDRAPILLKPNATAKVAVPQAPPNARFAVVVHKVSANPRLSGPDVTTDFLEFPVEKKVRPGPTKDPIKSTK